jgi:hypothetical protein
LACTAGRLGHVLHICGVEVGLAVGNSNCAIRRIALFRIHFRRRVRTHPLGALARTDRRVPVGDDDGPVSLRWRHPLDAWLGTVADAVHAEVGIACPVIGFEIDAGKDAASFVAGLPEQRWEAIALPGPGGLVHTPANQ